MKFHVDEVKELGSFVEIEAGNLTDISKDESTLKEQCEFYMRELLIRNEDLIHCSYSDLLLEYHGA